MPPVIQLATFLLLVVLYFFASMGLAMAIVLGLDALASWLRGRPSTAGRVPHHDLGRSHRAGPAAR